MAVPDRITAWQMETPDSPLVSRDVALPPLGDEDALIKIAGCGLCHTDLSFLYGGVRTKKEPPLTLGHEFSGEVVATGKSAARWRGRKVVVPAVLPCNNCDLCRAGRGNACRHQIMPGNDIDGGFASHAVVPAKHLCPVQTDTLELWQLGVLADAVTTPFQAMVRAEVHEGDTVIVVGVGGIGTYGVQIAAALGATVLALDVDREKLRRIVDHGATAVLEVTSMSPKEVKTAVRGLARDHNLKSHSWKVFEMSGTAAGQATAYELLSFAGTVGFVGYSPEKVPVRLGNLMAYDATVFGNWGCHPSLYSDALEMVRDGRVQISPFVKKFPLSSINQVVDMARNHRLTERAVLVP